MPTGGQHFLQEKQPFITVMKNILNIKWTLADAISLWRYVTKQHRLQKAMAEIHISDSTLAL